jgi:chemotaxis protein MotA
MSFMPIGLFIGVIAFAAAIAHLGQSADALFDVVALIMVLGGTVASAVMVLPWELLAEIRWAFSKIFTRAGFRLKDVVAHCEQASKTKSCPPSAQKRIYGSLLKEGFELSELGIEPAKVQEILHERLNARIRRLRRVTGVLRGIAKYPPAFGLMGTVLGLVNVMRGVSRGMPATETALQMALALVATMYGLVMANLIIGPFGEILSQAIQGEEYAGEIAITAVILSLTEDSQLVTSEFLQSYLGESERSSSLDFEGAA